MLANRKYSALATNLDYMLLNEDGPPSDQASEIPIRFAKRAPFADSGLPSANRNNSIEGQSSS